MEEKVGQDLGRAGGPGGSPFCCKQQGTFCSLIDAPSSPRVQQGLKVRLLLLWEVMFSLRPTGFLVFSFLSNLMGHEDLSALSFSPAGFRWPADGP